MTKQGCVNIIIAFSVFLTSCNLLKKTSSERHIYKHDTIYLDTTKTLLFNLQKTINELSSKEAIINTKDTIIKIDTLYFKVSKTEVIYKEQTQKTDTIFIALEKKDNYIKKQSKTSSETDKRKNIKLSDLFLYILIFISFIILYFAKK